MINLFTKGTQTVRLKWCFLLVINVLLFASCSTIRTTTYFRNVNRDTVITVPTAFQEELKIQKGDILNLTISSLSKDEDLLYAIPGGYEVNNNGEIHVHHLGKISVVGLTRKQLKAKLETDLGPYLKDPVVAITFTNHHFTVLGSVGNPQVYPLPTEKITIIDALASSGNVVPSSDLAHVIVIRDSSVDKKQIKHLNLEDHSVFNSDFFYLRPNDVVVVKPDEEKLDKEQKRLQYQQVSSIVLQVITIGLIIYNTFFRN